MDWMHFENIMLRTECVVFLGVTCCVYVYVIVYVWDWAAEFFE